MLRVCEGVTLGYFESHVEGSPATMDVFPGATDTVVVEGDPTVNVQAGSTVDLNIIAFDADGNRRAVGGDDEFRIALRETAVSPNIIDDPNTYTNMPSSEPVLLPAESLVSTCADVGGRNFWRGTADYIAYRIGTYRACGSPVRQLDRTAAVSG